MAGLIFLWNDYSTGGAYGFANAVQRLKSKIPAVEFGKAGTLFRFQTRIAILRASATNRARFTGEATPLVRILAAALAVFRSKAEIRETLAHMASARSAALGHGEASGIRGISAGAMAWAVASSVTATSNEEIQLLALTN